MYITNDKLTDAYIQSLIALCGFTDVTAQYPDWGSAYVIQDRNGQLNSMSIVTARDFLLQQYQIINPSAGVSQTTDQNYPDGTVVCPTSVIPYQLVQCTHDNCPFALVYTEEAIASTGSVRVKTAFDILARKHVVSDGRGGVRAAAAGESAFVVGFTTAETVGAQVYIILKSYFGVVV